jgi:hypothetical protein
VLLSKIDCEDPEEVDETVLVRDVSNLFLKNFLSPMPGAMVAILESAHRYPKVSESKVQHYFNANLFVVKHAPHLLKAKREEMVLNEFPQEDGWRGHEVEACIVSKLYIQEMYQQSQMNFSDQTFVHTIPNYEQ